MDNEAKLVPDTLQHGARISSNGSTVQTLYTFRFGVSHSEAVKLFNPISRLCGQPNLGHGDFPNGDFRLLDTGGDLEKYSMRDFIVHRFRGRGPSAESKLRRET